MTRKIAFFDSGIGGLTVLHKALQQFPEESYIYYADTLHVPYGTKSADEVRGYILGCIEAIVSQNAEAIVIACNTATSLAVSELRSRYDIPIIGMEPAVKPAVEMNRDNGKRVLVFATALTLSQTKYNELVSRVDDEHRVDSLALPELVEWCEQLQFDPVTIAAYFRSKLSYLDMERYGTVVMGCTHYPFYSSILQGVLPEHVRIVDGSAGTVNHLKQRLALQTHRHDKSGGIVEEDVTFLSSSGRIEDQYRMRIALQYLKENSL
ncbi:glutamate racemase [Paenibacillus barcinonensis]|uniref:Glutamate racemase n=1 Tax=Paenibacillus barcinonensis TaxID=198119 RepID=A0A2V4V619_PAEBA|nr:glutamate racemase [Paenibacillus barcinonensis]PYE47745.1 glutamate racemase [Paenibacillus barcinonensis]